METSAEAEMATTYSHGLGDVFTVFFYLLIAVVLHAVVQKYILDNLKRMLDISEHRHPEFDQSGQLLVFYVISITWGTYIVIKGGYFPNSSQLWDGYPHTFLSFRLKLYFITQMAYWFHIFPELYFQRNEQEEVVERIKLAAFHLVFIVSAYLMNLFRVALLCLVLHYVAELTFHLARISSICGYKSHSSLNLKMLLASILPRGCIFFITVHTVWDNLGQLSNQGLDLHTGNFNTIVIRIMILVGQYLFQLWSFFNFLMFHLLEGQHPPHVQTGRTNTVMPPHCYTSPSSPKSRQD